jgi:hypothetical protein
MSRTSTSRNGMLLAAVLAGSIVVIPAVAQSPTGAPNPSTATTARPVVAAARTRSARVPRREKLYYELNWGVDSMTVKLVESGEMVRFTYRVLDPAKAKMLNDKKHEPFLLDESAHVKLVVPTMEKVGQLRQTATPEKDRSYWMVFSNKGRPVKAGDHVTVEIGSFRVEGLVVQ